MKKLIAILTIMIVLVGAVFAANNDELKVTAKVDEHIPGFKIFGGTSSGSITVEGAQTPNVIATSLDISMVDITVYFKLTQYSNTTTPSYNGNKAKFKGTANLTVTADPLSATIDETTYSTAIPVAANITTPTISGITSSSSNTTSNIVKVTLVYDGRSVQDADVATFDFTWTAKDELPPADTYAALITLTYETV